MKSKIVDILFSASSIMNIWPESRYFEMADCNKTDKEKLELDRIAIHGDFNKAFKSIELPHSL